MYVTFKNNSTGSDMTIVLEKQKYVIKPRSSVDVFCRTENFTFLAATDALTELIDAVNEIDDKDKTDSLKNRILTKITKKAFQKLPDTVLNTTVQYEVSGANAYNTVIDLYDGAQAVCGNKIADFLDVIPVCSVFPQAETTSGSIRVADANNTNRRTYRKLIRNILLFQNIGLTSLNLLFFLPEMLIINFLSSDFYMKKMLTSLYTKSADERKNILAARAERSDFSAKKKGRFPAILKILIILFVLGTIIFWGITDSPDVLISEDFNTVVCFEETYIKTDEALPPDAKDVFLEDYWAWYPLGDDEYDTDNYYCYIYETPDGERWLWLKDNCSDKANKDKDYADYKNPLVYKLSPT